MASSWKDKAAGRRLLLAGARRRHEWNPTVKSRALVALRKRQVAQADRNVARAAAKARADDARWGGARAVTNDIIAIVGDRAPVTSRKRSETFGNPDSDHHVSQRDADAVDFGIAEAHALKNEVSRRLGGPRILDDYGSFIVRRGGRSYRVQGIAGTHGTGPHLHFGVRRA